MKAEVTQFFFSSRRRHTRCSRDWSSDVCSSDLLQPGAVQQRRRIDLASGAGGERDLLALEIGLVLDARLACNDGLEVRIFHAREKGDRLSCHGRGGDRRLCRRRDVCAAADDGVEALLSGGEIAYRDIEAALFEKSLIFRYDHNPRNRPEVLGEPGLEQFGISLVWSTNRCDDRRNGKKSSSCVQHAEPPEYSSSMSDGSFRRMNAQAINPHRP